MSEYFSIVQDNFEDKVCIECGSHDVELHHIFEGRQGFKKKSEKYGLVCYLCRRHHQDHADGVHHLNKALDYDIKVLAEARWLAKYNKTIDEWREEFNKNYLEEDYEQG